MSAVVEKYRMSKSSSFNGSKGAMCSNTDIIMCKKQVYVTVLSDRSGRSIAVLPHCKHTPLQENVLYVNINDVQTRQVFKVKAFTRVNTRLHFHDFRTQRLFEILMDGFVMLSDHSAVIYFQFIIL